MGGLQFGQLRGLAPYLCLCPSKLSEFGRAQRRLRSREEFVKLWRWHRGAAEHRMRLAAMMDLVLEQMQQETIGTFQLHT
jgi:hypothetical protein